MSFHFFPICHQLSPSSHSQHLKISFYSLFPSFSGMHVYRSLIMFCCQCSKPLTYGIALDQLGSDLVHQYVGQEPSGRNFNELVLDHNSEWAYMPCFTSFRWGLHCNLSCNRFIFVPGRQWFKSTFSPCISSNTYIPCIYYLNTFVGLKIYVSDYVEAAETSAMDQSVPHSLQDVTISLQCTSKYSPPLI